MFLTETKQTGRIPLGPQGLHAIVRSVGIPVVGIGGITPENVDGVARAGAAAAAVIGGLFGSPRGPRLAATALRNLFQLSMGTAEGDGQKATGG